MAEGAASAAGEALDGLSGGGQPSHPAFLVPDDGQVLSYAEMAGRIETLAGRLAAAGVRRGDRVALALPNGPDFVQLLLAVALLGAAAAPLNPAYTEPEYTFYLEDLAPRLLLVPASLPAAAAAAAAATGTAVLGVADVAGGPPDLLRDGRAGDRPARLRARHAGRRRAAPAHERHHEPAEAGAAAAAQPLAATRARSPPTTSSARTTCRTARCRCSTCTASSPRRSRRWPPAAPWSCPRRLSPAAVLAAGARGRASPGSRPARRCTRCSSTRSTTAAPPGTLRFVRSCSSALSPELMHAGGGRSYGVPMLEAYGMTEASHQMASNPLPPAERVPGSVGVPAGAEIGIVDGSGGVAARGRGRRGRRSAGPA